MLVTETRLENNIKSNLQKEIQELLQRIFDIEMLQGTLRELKVKSNHMQIDLNKMPLGKLTQTSIFEAYKILGEIEKVLEYVNK